MAQPDGGPPGYRKGLISKVTSLARAGVAIAPGDLLAQFGDYVETFAQAEARPGPTEFFDFFLGLLESEAQPLTQGTPVVVLTGGQCLYPLDVPAARYCPCGTFVTAVDDRVVKVDLAADLSKMIGKLCEPVRAGDTWALFELRSRVMS